MIYQMKRFLFILLLFPILGIAQEDIPFSEEFFPDQKAELQIALQNMEEGNHWYERGHSYLKSALHYYLDVRCTKNVFFCLITAKFNFKPNP